MQPGHHRSVTDEVILEGFRSLHEAMAAGFDAINRRIDALDVRIGALEQRVGTLERRVGTFEQRVGTFEARMLRRFDDVDARLAALEPAG